VAGIWPSFPGSVHRHRAPALQPAGGLRRGILSRADEASAARAEQEARSRGCSAEDVKQVIFAVVAFLDESALGCRNPVFADWPRLPLQAEFYGHQVAGEIFFQELQKAMNRPDSVENRGSARSLLPLHAARF